MVFKKIIFFLFLYQFIFAEESKVADQPMNDLYRVRTSRELRNEHSLSAGINWNLISMWMPNKIGINSAYNYSDRKTIALEYQYSSIKAAIFDFKFGEIRESKYGIILKSFGDANSFYFSYGLMKYQMKAELAIELFGSKSLPIAPLFDIGSTGFQFGIGNQFNWDNGFTLGIDWVSIYLPYFSKTKNTEIFSLLDQTARDDANKIVDLIYNLPIIELFKVQLNYSF